MFEKVVKCLLQGDFICEVSDEAGFQYLKDSDNTEKVELFLGKLNYRLAKTQNNLAFYSAYQVLDGNARGDIRKIFSQFRVELHPVVEWLDMMMSCHNQDYSLSPGDTISFSSLLQIIEQKPAQATRLQKFSYFKDFSGSDDSLKSRLEKLLSTLQKWGYLSLVNRDTLIYKVTGKLDYFYQALQFIKDHEQLPIDQSEEDAAAIQEELF